MVTVRSCIDAVLAAAEEESQKKKKRREGESRGSGAEETIFSRLRAVAPAVAAIDPSRTDDAAACLRREAGLLYFAGIGEWKI